MKNEKDPYFCMSCGHKGVHDGIISVTSTCEKCESLLIVPLAVLHMLDYELLVISMPSLEEEQQQYKKMPAGKRHLKVVPPPEDLPAKQGTTTGGNNGEKND